MMATRQQEEEGLELECASFTPTEEPGQRRDEEDKKQMSNAVLDAGAGTATLSSFKSVVSIVVPKIEPLPRPAFFSLSVLCAVPCVVYILLFTQMGYGEYFYYALSHSQLADYSSMLAGGLVLSGFFLYIFDVDEWDSHVGNLFRALSAVGMLSAFVLLIMLISNEFPCGIITIFALVNPVWLLACKALFYRSRDTRTFVSWLSGPLLLIGALTAAAFVAWVCTDFSNEWNPVTRVEAAERTGCAPDMDSYPDCVDGYGAGGTCFYVDYSGDRQALVFPENCDRLCLRVYNACANGFILWSGPVDMCLSLLFLSFFCTFLRKEGTTNETDVFNFGKLWCFVLFIMWASASLSGTAAGVTSSLLSTTLANLVGSCFILYAIFTKKEINQSKEAVMARIHQKYGNNNLDVARGLLVVTCFPLIGAYFLLSAIKQLVRRIGFNPCAKPAYEEQDPDENAGIITVGAKKHLARIRSWNWAKVLTYAVYWGVAYMILQVLVANLTVVFLSWMIEKTTGIGLLAVTAIISAVGVFMFLLPPVPGVPVYLTLGIVLPAQGHELLGWTGSILYSTGVGLLLKLFSSMLQQKMIGENLSHHVKVRQFVSINSTPMKVMRLVIGRDGLSVPKVAMLIGGPDWPTSVLCGIMRLSLPQIMLGTLPIVFLIFPTCLTGAFLFMSSLQTDTGYPQFPWADTLSTFTASATAMVQFGSMFVAAYYLEKASKDRVEDVEAIKDDKEVKEADDKDEHMKECYKTVTQWNALPLLSKLVLISSLVSITASCYMVQFFYASCFVDHSLTDSIGENLGGNVGNLFLPLGWASVALFATAIILLVIFSSWGKHQAKKLSLSGKAVPLNNSSDL